MKQFHSYACNGFSQMSRRHMLKVGGLGLLGLTMPGLLRAAELKKGPIAKAKSVIFLYQFGGPSHIDMFDMKPDAPEAIRGRKIDYGTGTTSDTDAGSTGGPKTATTAFADLYATFAGAADGTKCTPCHAPGGIGIKPCAIASICSCCSVSMRSFSCAKSKPISVLDVCLLTQPS